VYYQGLFLQWLIETLQGLETKLKRQHRPRGAQVEVDLRELDAQQLSFVTPYFVLSTGRCGTLWLTRLLRLSKYVRVNHSDYPELIRHSRLAYERYGESPEVFQEIIRATRDEPILRAHRHRQIYVETNNRITFFAYAIRQVYPHAKFIHLVRHPGDFVRSGLSRGWYSGQGRHDLGRITDQASPGKWDAMSRQEKIAWLWNETNLYVEQFLESLEGHNFIQAKSEDMFRDTRIARDICEFVGANDITKHMIDKMQKRVINRGNRKTIEPYDQWSTIEKERVREEAKLADSYGYVL
jgi:hypothetical protein